MGYALVGLGVFLRSRSRLNKIRFTARELGKIRTRLVVIDDEGRRVHYRIASGNREELERLEAKEEDLVAELEEKKPE